MLERDGAKRKKMYQDMQAEFRKTSPFVMLYQQTEVAAVRSNVDGFKLGPTSDTTYMFTGDARSEQRRRVALTVSSQRQATRTRAPAADAALLRRSGHRADLPGAAGGDLLHRPRDARSIRCWPSSATARRAVVAQVREEMGLNKPLYEQFCIYVGKVLHGDFGTSVLTANPVMQDIRAPSRRRWSWPRWASSSARGFGVPLGVWAAVRRGGLVDQVVRVIGLVGYSVPIFWLGLMALVLFYAKLGWVGGPGRIDVVYRIHARADHRPAAARRRHGRASGRPSRNVLSHLILPASLLGYFSLAYISRMTRSFMLNELAQEYVVAARAKGLSEARIIWRHALRNAMVPLVTVIALSYAGLLEGSVLTETVFAWPGLGLYITNSLQNADMNAVLGGTIVVGAVFIGLNLLPDLLTVSTRGRARERHRHHARLPAAGAPAVAPPGGSAGAYPGWWRFARTGWRWWGWRS